MARATTIARSTTVVGCSMRAGRQEQLRNLEAKKEAYRAKSREADEAQRLADAGEGHYRREYILREEAVLIARELNQVFNVIPGQLLNGCADATLKAEWRHSLVIRTAKSATHTKAVAELDETQRLLRNVERDLDRFFPADGWKKVESAEGIWKPVLTRLFDQNMLDSLERAAVELQHAQRITQRVFDEATAELAQANANTVAAREALIWSPV